MLFRRGVCSFITDMNKIKDRIASNLDAVRERMSRAESLAGAVPGSVTLVGVTKNRTVTEIEAALECGLTDIGENRVQEALAKLPQLVCPAGKHLVGHLQRNKVRDVVGRFDLVQSVDSERLARALDERAGREGLAQRILMQVNTSGEPSKFGVEIDSADHLLEVIAGLPNLKLDGLMTIGPLTDSTVETVKSFRTLRALFEKYSSSAVGGGRMKILSMGMSSDFELAIAEGANMVRVGTAIFGSRT